MMVSKSPLVSGAQQGKHLVFKRKVQWRWGLNLVSLVLIS